MLRARYERVVVGCYHCGNKVETPRRATAASCPRCGKRIVLGDVTIKRTCWVARVETAGRVIVEKNGRVKAGEIRATRGVKVLGEVEAKIVSLGPVFLGKHARVRGGVRAPKVHMEPGAIVEGGRFEITAEGHGRARRAG